MVYSTKKGRKKFSSSRALGSLGKALKKAVQNDPNNRLAKAISVGLNQERRRTESRKRPNEATPSVINEPTAKNTHSKDYRRKLRPKSGYGSHTFRNGNFISGRLKLRKHSNSLSATSSLAGAKVYSGKSRTGGKGGERERPRDEPSPLHWSRSPELNNCLTQQPETFSYLGCQQHWTRYQDNPEGGLELFIGLDFGTTFTKVVISEPGANRSWAVPLSSNRRNPFVLKSQVYLDDGSFNLDSRGECFSGLKVPFLTDTVSESDCHRIAAFMALVINYSKQWMLNEQTGFLAGQKPIWFVNVGLPAKDFEQGDLVSRYTGLAWTALLLASRGEHSLDLRRVMDASHRVDKAIQTGQRELRNIGGITVHRDQVNVYPEIMAQLYGFLRSRHWDEKKPEFMLVDVGGGTVDSTVFNVTKENGTDELSFWVFKSQVQMLGTLELHRRRLDWILEQIGEVGPLAGLKKSLEIHGEQDNFWMVPDRIQDYLNYANFGTVTCDDLFLGCLKKSLLADQLRYVLTKINPRFCQQGRNYPFILAGGGSGNWVYKQLLDAGPVVKNVRVESQPLMIPDNLIPEIENDIYHRVSVAYGLAFDNLGRVITPERIRELEVPPEPHVKGPDLISKEHV